MTDAFSHPRRRLARARHHVEAFNAELDQFMSSNPQQLLQEINADGSRRKLILALGPIPGECEDHAVDAIAGLRATLDYAAFASASILGANEPRSAYFPFGDTAAGLESTIKGRCKDLHTDVVDYFRSLEPFNGGAGDLLWALNKLRGRTEHASVVEARFHIPEGRFDIPQNVDPSTVTVFPFEWDIENHCVVMAEVGPARPDVRYSFHFPIRVTLPEAPHYGQQPASAIFEPLLVQLETIITETENLTRRLKP